MLLPNPYADISSEDVRGFKVLMYPYEIRVGRKPKVILDNTDNEEHF